MGGQKAKGQGAVRKSPRKAKDKGRVTAEKTAKADTPAEETPKDFAEVRRNIANLVRASAIAIAKKAIELAEGGQLAQTKYLFEAVGLYPPTADTSPQPEDSLAYTLLKRLGLPTEPVFWEEDGLPAAPAGEVKPVSENGVFRP